MSESTDEEAVVAKIKDLPAYNDIAARIHEVITEAAPDLKPRLWYGMPGYAHAKSKPVILFFRVDADDYLTLGLTEKAHLPLRDDQDDLLIQSAWFLTALDAPTEQRIADIARTAAGVAE